LIFHDRDPYDDYHKSTNADLFEKWIKDISEKIPAGSVIVMDSASYHNRLSIPKPNMTWRKESLMNFIIEHCDDVDVGVEFHTYTKVQLMELIKQSDFYHVYAVDQILQEKDINVLRLPPYHCELNPIQYAWSGLKQKVRRRNVGDQTVQTVREIIYQSFHE